MPQMSPMSWMGLSMVMMVNTLSVMMTLEVKKSNKLTYKKKHEAKAEMKWTW